MARRQGENVRLASVIGRSERFAQMSGLCQMQTFTHPDDIVLFWKAVISRTR